jgi:nucleotide-binding universal stress UspA family protein
MKTINRIMVAIDLSVYSEQTLAYAVMTASAFKARLTVVNVINSRDLEMIRRIATNQLSRSNEAYALKAEDEYIANTTTERSQTIDLLLAEHKEADLTVDVQFKTGVPFKELLVAAEEGGADLMVIGAKGRSNVMDVLFGSTAENIQRLSKIPVLSVRTSDPL